MPVFRYSGLNASGKQIRGVLDAESPKALREALKSKGIFLVKHVEGAKAKLETGEGLQREVDLSQIFGRRISTLEVAMMTRQLATLQRAGVPLLESLNAIVEQIDKETFKRILSDVRERVNEGSSLANALKEHPKVFSDLYVNMVRAGETSGNLDLVLERLASFLENQADLRGKVMSALYYPIIMGVLGTGIVTFLFTYVIPKVVSIFEEQGQALPWVTRRVIGLTNFITTPLYMFIVVVVVGLLLYGFREWKSTPDGRYKWDKAKLRFPLLGKTLRMLSVTRFTGTLGTLLGSGVPLLSAMNIVKAVVGNARLQEVIDDVRANVREGESIAGPLKRSGEFPPIVIHMIAIGERTGRLESMLNSVADSYEKQLDNRLRALTSLLEPAIIVVMGIVVAIIVFAVLMPILKLGQGFQQT